ncbi:uncharacterized protein LTR77_011149 [Saxophila tyrrhenica]|uniref:Major facilitator superfamily (MFS) profile domain-containing protein n=1 Tax=Saxophila tyrrhenica TaxID=1690608 RepID=A0AAV9NXA4_9PEZI|nr:hypothetical protein LTR77_011149 [Saxophila tyrrhenica]
MSEEPKKEANFPEVISAGWGPDQDLYVSFTDCRLERYVCKDGMQLTDEAQLSSHVKFLTGKNRVLAMSYDLGGNKGQFYRGEKIKPTMVTPKDHHGEALEEMQKAFRVSFSDDGKKAAWVQAGAVKFRPDLSDGSPPCWTVVDVTCDTAAHGSLGPILFSPDGSQLAVVFGLTLLIGPATTEEEFDNHRVAIQILEPQPFSFSFARPNPPVQMVCAAFHPRGTEMALGCNTCQVILVNVKTKKEESESSRAMMATLSPDTGTMFQPPSTIEDCRDSSPKLDVVDVITHAPRHAPRVMLASSMGPLLQHLATRCAHGYYTAKKHDLSQSTVHACRLFADLHQHRSWVLQSLSRADDTPSLPTSHASSAATRRAETSTVSLTSANRSPALSNASDTLRPDHVKLRVWSPTGRQSFSIPQTTLNDLEKQIVRRPNHDLGCGLDASICVDNQDWSAYKVGFPLDDDYVSANDEVMECPAERTDFSCLGNEFAFWLCIAMTSFLTEYLVSGFAMELPRLLEHGLRLEDSSGATYWPGSLLTMTMSAGLLIFARVSDMYTGYLMFLGGIAWLTVWTLIPGFCHGLTMLNTSRAMQGVAIAAFTPAAFSLIGNFYPEGKRRNFVIGVYSGSAPLGCFGGFLTASALPSAKLSWFFRVAAIVAAVTFAVAILVTPRPVARKRVPDLHMDFVGAGWITCGLLLVSYALSAAPYQDGHVAGDSSFTSPAVLCSLSAGMTCLAVALRYEGWVAKCPLLPFEFFRPRNVLPLTLASLFFYATFGVWLYNSARYILLTSTTDGDTGPSGITLALWYTPTAVGGTVLCIVGGSLIHLIPTMAVIAVSAVAWVAAPLLFALAPLPLPYWTYVMPSMLCATMGIDLTFTVSVVFLSSVQPARYQGLVGAVCSSLFGLGVSFALAISGLIMDHHSDSHSAADEVEHTAYEATFFYATGSAFIGLLICLLFLRISLCSRTMVVTEDPFLQLPRPLRP